MISQQGVALTFYAFYTTVVGAGLTGLTPTVDVYEGITGSPIVTAASATALGGGIYYYTLASGSVDANGAYIAIFKSAAGSEAQQHLPALWSVGTSGLATQTSVDDLPTNSELATSQAAADDATLAAIAALNNLSSAQAQTAATAALNAYDPPTKAELDTGLAAADDATLAAIAGLNNLSAAQVNSEADTALADVGLTTTITGRIDAAITSRLATGGYTAPPTVADILAGVIEGSITLKGALRLALSALTGKASGGGTTTVIFRDTGDTKARITATVDSSGNRTAITRDITD